MLRRTTIRTIAGAWLVAALIFATSGPASAKGAQDATLTGPGIRGTLHIVNVPQGPSAVDVNRLAEAQHPHGPLGPRYRIVYRLYTGENEVTPVRQIVYPFAHAGFVTYTPPGQRMFHKNVRSGWYTSAVQAGPVGGGIPSESATALFVSVGVPDRTVS